MKKILLIISMVLAWSNIQAQSFSKDVVPIISAGGPGGVNAQIIQALQPVISNILGVQVPIDYKPGAGTMVALNHITSAGKERKTLKVTIWAPSKHNLLTDVKPVLHLGESSKIMFVRADANIKSVHDLLTNKSKFTVGVSSPLQTEIWLNAARHHNPKHEITLVPYRSGIEVITAVLGGHIDVGETPGSALLSFIADNRLIPIANVSTQRSNVLPNVPTLQEQTGWKYEGWPYLSWFQYASLGTDDETVLRLRRHLSEYVRSQEGKNFIAKFDLNFSNQTFDKPEIVLRNIQSK